MIKPLNNNCLIEVIDEYEGVLRNTDNENVQKGVLKEIEFEANHLTTSTGYLLPDLKKTADFYKDKLGKTVYWQEYADSGSKFTIDGKQFVLVPFYRLIGWEA